MSSPTDQCILDGLRNAYYNLAISGAQAYSINGRTFTRFQIGDIQKAIVFFEARIDAAGQPGIGGGTVLVQLGNTTSNSNPRGAW